MSSGITVCIPTIPPRAALLGRAITSVLKQTYPAEGISVAIDTHKQGAAHTRNRAWRGSATPWVAFLDDDDEMLPQHLQLLAEHQEVTGADVVYPWFHTSPPNHDPISDLEHLTWDATSRWIFPITTLVRRSALEHVGGFPESERVSETCAGEDYAMWMKMQDEGIKIASLDHRTWIWHMDSNNTSGLPTRW